MSKVVYLLLSLLVTFSVSADILCAKNSSKLAKNGSYTVAKNLKLASGSCPKGYTQVLDTDNYISSQSVAGPQGPQGLKGDAGILNLGSCRTAIETSAIIGTNDVGAVIADCNSNEFLLTHGGNANSLDVDIIAIGLRGFAGEGFASGIQYDFGRNNIAITTTVAIAATAVCCAR